VRVVMLRAVALRFESGGDHGQLDARHARAAPAHVFSPVALDAVVVSEEDLHAGL
jgi:hypothetical protein